MGFVAGHILGPVLCHVHSFRNPTTGEPGFVTVCINTPEAEGEEEGVYWMPAFQDKANRPNQVWVNVWCTDNIQREEVGVSYCEVKWSVKPASPKQAQAEGQQLAMPRPLSGPPASSMTDR